MSRFNLSGFYDFIPHSQTRQKWFEKCSLWGARMSSNHRSGRTEGDYSAFSATVFCHFFPHLVQVRHGMEFRYSFSSPFQSSWGEQRCFPGGHFFIRFLFPGEVQHNDCSHVPDGREPVEHVRCAVDGPFAVLQALTNGNFPLSAYTTSNLAD
mgnify:CR=1 FL=1